jgi:uncharacterized lipoprotein
MRREFLLSALGLSMLSGCETNKEQKNEVDQRLKELKTTPKTNELPITADCYSISIQPDRVEKIDPVSGEKTLTIRQ